MLEKEIHCKLQETSYTLQSRAATYKGFKKSLQSLQKVKLLIYFVQSPESRETSYKAGVIHYVALGGSTSTSFVRGCVATGLEI